MPRITPHHAIHPDPIRPALYLRVSTDEQADSGNIRQQPSVPAARPRRSLRAGQRLRCMLMRVQAAHSLQGQSAPASRSCWRMLPLARSTR